MRVSQFFISTLKEAPTEAELISHKLMLRAGLIKRLGSGLYTWMPLGLRILRKVENIVREEMNASDAIEVLMPAVQPSELWQETGRWDALVQPMKKSSQTLYAGKLRATVNYPSIFIKYKPSFAMKSAHASVSCVHANLS